MSLAGTDWLFSLGAALLAAAGVALLLWALWGDWLRGVLAYRRTGTRRRRCPKCWYDMSGVEGLRCPECGREAKCEARLHRSRRRRRWAALACLIGALAWGLSRGPIVRAKGWAAAVPTAALVVVLPWLEPPGPKAVSRVNPTGSPHSIREALWVELLTNRLRRGSKLPSWQRALVIRNGMRDALTNPNHAWSQHARMLWAAVANQPLTDEEWRAWLPRLLPKMIRTRERWPEGVEVYVRLAEFEWMSQADIVFQPTQLGAVAMKLNPMFYARRFVSYGPSHGYQMPGWFDGAKPILLFGLRTQTLAGELLKREFPPEPTAYSRPDPDDPRWKPRPIGQVELPIRIEGAIDECMRRVSIPAVDAALRGGTFAGTAIQGMMSVTLDQAATAAIVRALTAENATFAARLEMRRDGEVIVSQRVWWSASPAAYERLPQPPMDWHIFPAMGMNHVVEEHTWTLRITPDQEFALRDFESERCWDGAPIEVPVEVKRGPSAPPASPDWLVN